MIPKIKFFAYYIISKANFIILSHYNTKFLNILSFITNNFISLTANLIYKARIVKKVLSHRRVIGHEIIVNNEIGFAINKIY